MCRAQTNPSLIGCHSQVWVGGWDEKDIRRSVEGTKNAGFDLIEGARSLVASLKSSDNITAFTAITLAQRRTSLPPMLKRHVTTHLPMISRLGSKAAPC